jgi:hypothetical protein
MKKFLKHVFLLLLLAGTFSSCTVREEFRDEDTDFYYNDKGEKEIFKIRKDKVIVKCKSETDVKALAVQSIFSFAYNGGLWVTGSIDPKKTKLEDLLRMSEVVSAAYGLESIVGDGSWFYPMDNIAVKLKEGYTMEDVIEAANITNSVTAIELSNPLSYLYLIYLDVELGDILRISRLLYETGLCEIAAPPLSWNLINVHYNN